MKVWRRSQSAQIAPMAVQAPGALQQLSVVALGALWSDALALANETLRAAQAGWDRERTEAETLREQMANAYEAQVTELEAAQAEVARLRADNERIHGEMAWIQRHFDDTQREIAVARTAVKREEARSIEIELRAGHHGEQN
ncbi:MAG: DNA-binding protein [Telluria sp.]|nr:DNA-binding protein [Telluria sp.]